MASDEEPRWSFVPVQGGNLEVLEFGREGDLVVCAAGNGRPGTQFLAIGGGLAQAGFHAISYNYRGIAGSTAPYEDITLHDQADDVWAIADAFGAEAAHLVGKTYGNRVMRAAASDHPERTLTVSLVGAGGEIMPSQETQDAYRRYLDPATSKEEWARLQGELNYAPGNEHLAPAAVELGSWPDVANAQALASQATPPEEWLGGGVAPMLVMVGLNDLVAVPENGLRIAESRPSTWLIGLANCGHSMTDEQPESILTFLTMFLNQRSL